MIDATTKSRLETLARLAFDERRWGPVHVELSPAGGIDVVNETGGVLLGITDHPHNEEALEVALLLLVARDKLDLLRVEAEVMAKRVGDGT